MSFASLRHICNPESFVTPMNLQLILWIAHERKMFRKMWIQEQEQLQYRGRTTRSKSTEVIKVTNEKAPRVLPSLHAFKNRVCLRLCTRRMVILIYKNLRRNLSRWVYNAY
jgi:hypothetical protein